MLLLPGRLIFQNFSKTFSKLFNGWVIFRPVGDAVYFRHHLRLFAQIQKRIQITTKQVYLPVAPIRLHRRQANARFRGKLVITPDAAATAFWTCNMPPQRRTGTGGTRTSSHTTHQSLRAMKRH